MSKETEEQPTAEVFETAKQYFEMATANTILTKPEIDSELCLVLMRDYALTKVEEYASTQQSTVTDKFEKANNALKKYILANPDKVRKDVKAMRDLSTPSTKEVTDEEIEKQFPQNQNATYEDERRDNLDNTQRVIGAKWLRSQQKAGSEWVSVEERLPTKQDANVKGEILVSTDVGSTILLSWKYAGQKSAGQFTFPFWQSAPQPPNNQAENYEYRDSRRILQ